MVFEFVYEMFNWFVHCFLDLGAPYEAGATPFHCVDECCLTQIFVSFRIVHVVPVYLEVLFHERVDEIEGGYVEVI